ncbi:MAG: EscU/YscU/HrcU family type III secretion system export apparatus switch protein [Exilispira sp.]
MGFKIFFNIYFYFKEKIQIRQKIQNTKNFTFYDQLLKIDKLDLQRFAAEDEGRTELPTETKKRRAREKGQVLKSQEIVALSTLLATLLSLFLFFPLIWQRIINLIYFFFQVDLSFSIENLDYFIKYALNQLLPVMGIIFIPPIIAGVASNVAQIGFLVVPSLLTPNLSRVAPNFSAYFKRIFSVEGFVNLLKGIGLVIGLLIIVILSINSSLGNLFESVSDSYQKTIELGINLFKSIFIKMIIILIIIAAVDYLMQRRRYIDSLKMSKQELLDELYEQEGRPEIRQALNKKRREIAQRKSLQNVKTADVVITNPTHFAVALKYEMGVDPAPRVVAKGEDLLAQQIKRIAFENDIITIENKPLARELYSRVSVGDYIPEDMLYIVANIYKYIYREYSKRKKPGYSWGG